jgi:hypothetical protein
VEIEPQIPLLCNFDFIPDMGVRCHATDRKPGERVPVKLGKAYLRALYSAGYFTRLMSLERASDRDPPAFMLHQHISSGEK